MLIKEIIAVCSNNRIKNINSVWKQNGGFFFSMGLGGAYRVKAVMNLRAICSPAEILFCSQDICSMELDISGATVTQINTVYTLGRRFVSVQPIETRHLTPCPVATTFINTVHHK